MTLTSADVRESVGTRAESRSPRKQPYMTTAEKARQMMVLSMIHEDLAPSVFSHSVLKSVAPVACTASPIDQYV